ncbi:MAG TPA: NlpC/P60 family protein [Acidimicrobiales bacterium]|nr:NlpC/P60 family protein [Acidimicrobiales bacterium]
MGRRPLEPGDLVFFGSATDHVTHRGLYLGDGQMINAPRTGAVVRVEPYRRANYLGATRPARRATSDSHSLIEQPLRPR